MYHGGQEQGQISAFLLVCMSKVYLTGGGDLGAIKKRGGMQLWGSERSTGGDARVWPYHSSRVKFMTSIYGVHEQRDLIAREMKML